MYRIFLFIFAFTHTSGQWVCEQDSDCSDLLGSACLHGACDCPAGQQVALSGTACVDLAPYYTSACVEDHQCSRLLTMFECRQGVDNQTQEGSCHCQTGHHYFLGRCWRTIDYGSPCARDEQCLGTVREPYSLRCNQTCVCADGYYQRQRGECRKIGYGVGDGCVIDEDCQFANGVCEINSLRCVLSTESRISSQSASTNVRTTPVNVAAVNVTVTAVRAHGVACGALTPCPEPFECSVFGACVCPVGYYIGEDGFCKAELGSQSSEDQCIGLLAEVIDGVCRCPPNFFYEENMRDCVRVTRRITDSCVSDSNCHTFGAASYCGPPLEPWGFRACACDAARAVWDAGRQMCRLFAGIGEQCEVDSDCLAGELEIQCVGGQCSCPQGLIAVDGLCLTTGLALNDSCQVTAECTETPNTVCSSGRCSCDEGYQELDGSCAAVIGGTCSVDDDCVIENTLCVSGTETCQCRSGFIAYEELCWPASQGFESQCNVTAQCVEALGDRGVCSDGRCACDINYHHRDGGCWEVTGLFENCRTTSQCYLASISERVVCRNSLCQCDFHYPYSEELKTCLSTSSARNILGSASLLAVALTYLILS